MSQTLELPDEVFERLQKVAAEAGKTPVQFIADATSRMNGSPTTTGEKPKTLRERMGGLIGSIRSGQRDERLSENCGEKFTDYLEQKRREGRL
jgi:hypothetical protein